MSKAKRNDALITAITASLSGAETGTVVSAGDVFNDNLPEGVTPEIVESVADYTSDFVASGLESIGTVGIAAMKKDKKLTDVGGSIGLGALGKVDYTVNRAKTITVPEKDGTTREMDVFGGNRIKVEFSPGNKTGNLKVASDAIKEAAAAAFKK